MDEQQHRQQHREEPTVTPTPVSTVWQQKTNQCALRRRYKKTDHDSPSQVESSQVEYNKVTTDDKNAVLLEIIRVMGDTKEVPNPQLDTNSDESILLSPVFKANAITSILSLGIETKVGLSTLIFSFLDSPQATTNVFSFVGCVVHFVESSNLPYLPVCLQQIHTQTTQR